MEEDAPSVAGGSKRTASGSGSELGLELGATRPTTEASGETRAASPKAKRHKAVGRDRVDLMKVLQKKKK
jgi:hypothetical protein